MTCRNRGLISTVTGGALLATAAATALGSSPTAGATCVSAFGIGNTAECSSTLASVALAIGAGAQAHADGLLGAAFAAGDGAEARTFDAFTFAVAAGAGSRAISGGYGGIALQLGSNGLAAADGPFLNIAVNISDSAEVPTPEADGAIAEAWGVGNVAVNLFGGSGPVNPTFVLAWGTANASVNLGGYETQVKTGPTQGTLNLGFAASGRNNFVTVGPGPLAIAGSINQTGATVTQSTLGININNLFSAPGSASTNPKTSRQKTKPADPASAKAAASDLRPAPAKARRAN